MGEFSGFALVPEQGAIPQKHQLDPDMQRRIEAMAARIDLSDNAAVMGFGARAQKEMGTFSDIALEQMLRQDIKPLESVMQALAEQIKSCSFTAQAKGLFRRVFGGAAPLAEVQAAYEKAIPRINACADEMTDRRVALMRELGIMFELGADVNDPAVAAKLDDFDAVVVAAGARAPRGLSAANIDAPGVVYAVDYLTASTVSVLDGGEPAVNARGLDVVVIGGGDTGNDCVGTAVRQGARSVRQFEFLPAAPDARAASNPWPQWPNVKKTDYGQQEAIAAMGGEMRAWGVDTLEVLLDKKGSAAGLRVADLDWSAGKPERIAGSEHEVPAQLVLIACGFTGPEHGVFDAVGVPVATAGRPLPVMAAEGSHLAARVDGVAAGATPVYVAGDARNGSSLVVSAMADALACAAEVAEALEL